MDTTYLCALIEQGEKDKNDAVTNFVAKGARKELDDLLEKIETLEKANRTMGSKLYKIEKLNHEGMNNL